MAQASSAHAAGPLSRWAPPTRCVSQEAGARRQEPQRLDVEGTQCGRDGGDEPRGSPTFVSAASQARPPEPVAWGAMHESSPSPSPSPGATRPVAGAVTGPVTALRSQLVLALQTERVKAGGCPRLVAAARSRGELRQAREDPSPPSFENLVVPTVVHFGGSGRCHTRYGRRGDGCEDPHMGRLTRSAGSCLKPPRPAGLARAGGAGVELRPGSAAAPVQPPGDPAALHLLMVSGPWKHPHPTPPLPANPWDHQGDLSPPVGHGGLPESLGSGEEAHGQGCKGVTARQRF